MKLGAENFQYLYIQKCSLYDDLCRKTRNMLNFNNEWMTVVLNKVGCYVIFEINNDLLLWVAM